METPTEKDVSTAMDQIALALFGKIGNTFTLTQADRLRATLTLLLRRAGEAHPTPPPAALAPERKAHDLKTWPEYFAALVDGRKTFEARKDDRGFQVGDTLRLREWSPDRQDYTGNVITSTVSYILRGPGFGVEAGYVVLGLSTPRPASAASDFPLCPSCGSRSGTNASGTRCVCGWAAPPPARAEAPEGAPVASPSPLKAGNARPSEWVYFADDVDAYVRALQAKLRAEVAQAKQWAQHNFDEAVKQCKRAEQAEAERDQQAGALGRLREECKPRLNTQDYRIAPGGDGPQAAEWKNKPHRLIYDLCREIERINAALAASAPEGEQP